MIQIGTYGYPFAYMHWLGLNWLDIIINVVVLAIVPGLLAAYGGHLAAEAINDQKRSRRVKRYFWGMFVFGVIATFWQQFRVGEADLARDTRDTWAQALAMKKFQPPPPPVIVGSPRQQPDLRLAFFTNEGALRFNIVNPTSGTATNPKFWFAIFDYANQYAFPQKPDVFEPLPKPAQTIQDFVGPKEGLGNFEVLNDAAKAHVKLGDRLFGVVFITCLGCRGVVTYWVYWEVGGTGWFSPVKAGDKAKLPYFQTRNVPNNKIDEALSLLVPPRERVAIPERDSLPIPLTPH